MFRLPINHYFTTKYKQLHLKTNQQNYTKYYDYAIPCLAYIFK